MWVIQLARFLAGAFILWMALSWVLPASEYMLKKSPVAIVRYAYSFITIYGLAVGLYIMWSENLESSLEGDGQEIFLKGLSFDSHMGVMKLAVFLALSFVLGNLARSYSNLHRIEEQLDFPLGIRIASFKGRIKVAELLLRLAMLVTILFLTAAIVAIRTASRGQKLEGFRTAFDHFWHLAQTYYVLLIVWDIVIYLGNRLDGTQLTKTVNSILRSEALPVHIPGLAVSLCMCLPRHFLKLSAAADLFDYLALSLAVFAWWRLGKSASPGTAQLYKRLRTLASHFARRERVVAHEGTVS